MKKTICLSLFCIIALISIASAAPTIGLFQDVSRPTSMNQAGFTHTVFAEYGSTTSCGYCPQTSSELYAIYQSGDLPFYYVSLVSNKNDAAKTRLGHYRTVAVPTVYSDGGYKNITGAVSEAAYRTMIQKSGERTVRDLQLTMTASGEGTAKIKITITVKNNGSLFYIGGILTYITEITSRWNDASGHAYHYACLDIPVKRPLVLLPKGSRTITYTWDGTAAGFSDISYDNIMVISCVCHWKPHQEIGYNDMAFTAFYVDQTAGTLVTS